MGDQVMTDLRGAGEAVGDDAGNMEEKNEYEYGDLVASSEDADAPILATSTSTVTSRPPPRMPTPPIMASTSSSARPRPIGS